jgi:hypothetical protein
MVSFGLKSSYLTWANAVTAVRAPLATTLKLSTGGLLNPLVYQRLCRLVGPLPDLPFVDIGAAGGSATIALARGYARSGKRSPILAIEKCRGGTSPQGRTGSANCRTPSWRRHAIVCDAGGSRPPGVIRWVKLRL